MKQICAKGKDLPISTKHAVAICRFIKGKRIEDALLLLEKVKVKKVAVPMKGEIPHRKAMSEMSGRGRYPVKASLYFIKLLKNLRGNATVQQFDADAVVVKIAKADKAAKPQRVGRLGRAGKSTNILLVGEEKEELKTLFEKKREERAKQKEKAEKKAERKEEEKKAEATTEAKEEQKEKARIEKEIAEEKKLREMPAHKEAEEFVHKEIEHEKEQADIFRRKERVIEKESQEKHKGR